MPSEACLKTTLLLLVWSASVSFAQTTIMLQGGVGARTPLIPLDHYSSIENSWKSSNLVNIGIEHFVTGSIAVMSNIEYNSYAFESYNGTIPDDASSNITGDATRIYRISIEGKFFDPPNQNFNFYLITGACYTVERVGAVELKIWPSNTYHMIPNQSKYYWMQTFGLGERWSFLNSFGVDLTGRLYTDYAAHFHESLMLGFSYIL
jgi:hypothetical protein